MGIHWTAIVFGLGAIGSVGCWTTDFLVVQRALPARDFSSARLTPIIGSFFKMSVPFIVTLRGLLSLAVLPFLLSRKALRRRGSTPITRFFRSCRYVTATRTIGAWG